MRINEQIIATMDRNDKTSNTKKTIAGRSSANSNADSASGVKKADSVELSARSSDIAEIAQQLKDSSEVREELVSELRAKIKDGTYHISSSDIASRIVGKAGNNIF